VGTTRISESVSIARPPADVWNAIADYSFDQEWRSNLTEMTPDPPGGPEPGTKVREVVRNMGRDYVTNGVVIELDPGISYRFSGDGTIGDVAGGRSVRPDGNGAIFTYDIELTPTGGSRLLGPLLGPMVRSGLKKDLGRLKELLEAER
jgi:uncharacterized protein YndB with AHSA1/START domain